MKTKALGRHFLIELYGCSPEVINDVDAVREAMLESARRADATIVAEVFHRFSPHGVSGVVVVAESHVAIHTWPEHGCASADVFSCGSRMRPEAVEEFLKEAFSASRSVSMELERGRIPLAELPEPVHSL